MTGNKTILRTVRLIRRKFAPLLLLGAINAWFTPFASAQVNEEAYREYFLIGQFGEVCTMCEVVILCEQSDTLPTYEQIPENGSFRLYHLRVRTFWSQVSTIWEFFIANFTTESLAQRGHARPVIKYLVTDGNWSTPEVAEARLVLEPPVLEFGDISIDRVDRSWKPAGSDDVAGYCQQLPLWDSLEALERFSTIIND